jgi:erythromycin esterase-like protein
MAGIDEMPKVVGWEKNDDNKIVPKVANLSAQMDPKKCVLQNSRVVIAADFMQTSGHKRRFEPETHEMARCARVKLG